MRKGGMQMSFRIVLVRDDESHEDVRKFEDFDDACKFLIEIADDIGKRPCGNTADMPKLAQIYDGARLEISLKIYAGGLLGGR
jgi:hypothetical protein